MPLPLIAKFEAFNSRHLTDLKETSEVIHNPLLVEEPTKRSAIKWPNSSGNGLHDFNLFPEEVLAAFTYAFQQHQRFPKLS